MSQYIEVYFKEAPLGVMSWNQVSQEGRFEFYPSFENNEMDLSPIRFSKTRLKDEHPILSFSLVNGQLIDIPPFLIDCLPGEYATTLLRHALKTSGKTPENLSPLALFSLLGNRGRGAFRFEPHGYPELDHPEAVDIGHLAKHARTIFQESGNGLTDNRFRELLRSGLFTTDFWPEAMLAINDYTGEVLSGQSEWPVGFEGWTLLLDGVFPDSEAIMANEYACYKKALSCGLDMLHCRQIKESNHTHLIVRRLDREKQKKIHIQSFTALSEDDSDSCEAVFKCMRLLRLPYPEHVNYYKRVVFNLLIGKKQETGRDILFTCHGQREWHLAPASGLNLLGNPGAHTLSIDGKTDNQTIEDVLALGKSQGIRKCADIVEDIQSCFKVVT